MAIAALAVAAVLSGPAVQTAVAQQDPDRHYGSYQPPSTTGPPVTYPPSAYSPQTQPPFPPLASPAPVPSPAVASSLASPAAGSAELVASPLASAAPGAGPLATPPPDCCTLPVTGIRGMTVVGAGLVLIGTGILAWVFAGRRRIRT